MSEEKKDNQDGGDAAEGSEWGEVIHSYSRREAIRDGVLVDVTHIAIESGFIYPVAMTRTVFEGFVVPDSIAVERGESTTGRLHDVLFVLRARIASARVDQDTIFFKVNLTSHGHPRTVRLKAMVSPGDDPRPVITVMLSGED